MATASSQLVSLATAFYLLPRVVNIVGLESFGLWSTVGSIIMLIGLADAATTASVMRTVAHAQDSERSNVLRAAIPTLGLLVTLVHIGVATFLVTLAHFPNVMLLSSDSDLTETWAALLNIGALIALSTSLSSISGGILMGLQKFWFRTLAQCAYCLTMLSGYVFFVIPCDSIITYGWVFLAATLVSSLFQLIAAALLMNKHLVHFTVSLRSTKNLVNFSTIMTVNQVADYLMYTTDRLILQYVCGGASVTIYHVASRCNDMGQAFISFPLSAIIPPLALADAQGQKDYIVRMVTTGSLIYAVLTIPVIGAWLALMKPFMTLWMGEGISIEATSASILFVSTTFVAIPFKVLSHLFVAQGLMRKIATVKCLYAVFNVCMSIYLAQRIGLIGVVLPTAFYWWCVHPGVILWIVRSTGIVSVITVLRLMIPVVAVFVISMALGITATYINIPYGWIGFFVLFAFYALLCGLVFAVSATFSNMEYCQDAWNYIRYFVCKKEPL